MAPPALWAHSKMVQSKYSSAAQSHAITRRLPALTGAGGRGRGGLLTCRSSLCCLMTLVLSSSSVDRSSGPWLHPLAPWPPPPPPPLPPPPPAAAAASPLFHLKHREPLGRRSTKDTAVREAGRPACPGLPAHPPTASCEGLHTPTQCLCPHTHTHARIRTLMNGRDVKAWSLSDALFTIGSPSPRLNVIPTLDITHSHLSHAHRYTHKSANLQSLLHTNAD